ncbi:hypothetical protein HK102_012333 [Quaeritorhiza haematococci]|nr:hypothetical protein HK102_012333 [Quaeritorhiza haematococci]
MSAPAYRTFLGQRVWPVPILKLYWPFFISGSTAFFMFSWAHTKLMDDPTDKWVNIVENVNRDSALQKMKNEAAAWYEAKQKGETPAAPKHH